MRLAWSLVVAGALVGLALVEAASVKEPARLHESQHEDVRHELERDDQTNLDQHDGLTEVNHDSNVDDHRTRLEESRPGQLELKLDHQRHQGSNSVHDRQHVKNNKGGHHRHEHRDDRLEESRERLEEPASGDRRHRHSLESELGHEHSSEEEEEEAEEAEEAEEELDEVEDRRRRGDLADEDQDGERDENMNEEEERDQNDQNDEDEDEQQHQDDQDEDQESQVRRHHHRRQQQQREDEQLEETNNEDDQQLDDEHQQRTSHSGPRRLVVRHPRRHPHRHGRKPSRRPRHHGRRPHHHGRRHAAHRGSHKGHKRPHGHLRHHRRHQARRPHHHRRHRPVHRRPRHHQHRQHHQHQHHQHHPSHPPMMLPVAGPRGLSGPVGYENQLAGQCLTGHGHHGHHGHHLLTGNAGPHHGLQGGFSRYPAYKQTYVSGGEELEQDTYADQGLRNSHHSGHLSANQGDLSELGEHSAGNQAFHSGHLADFQPTSSASGFPIQQTSTGSALFRRPGFTSSAQAGKENDFFLRTNANKNLRKHNLRSKHAQAQAGAEGHLEADKHLSGHHDKVAAHKHSVHNNDKTIVSDKSSGVNDEDSFSDSTGFNSDSSLNAGSKKFASGEVDTLREQDTDVNSDASTSLGAHKSKQVGFNKSFNL